MQTCSMVSTYVSTAWICFIFIICINTLCKRVEVDWDLQTKIFHEQLHACRSMHFLYINNIEVVNKIKKKDKVFCIYLKKNIE